jgi:hypothetical protein
LNETGAAGGAQILDPSNHAVDARSDPLKEELPPICCWLR